MAYSSLRSIYRTWPAFCLTIYALALQTSAHYRSPSFEDRSASHFPVSTKGTQPDGIPSVTVYTL